MSHAPDDASLGELVATATKDLSQLMRQEVELAKAEIKRDVAAAGKGAGMFGGAGFSGLFALVFLSIAAAYALGRVIPLGAGFLVVGLVYLLVAGVLALKGKKSLSGIGAPEKTIETLKDDAAWAKHPTVAPTRRT
ncbi:MAG: putative integral rane protein [Frankiales bacterium]|nr:putative integral rane protein [Frankiales bacterium]